MARAGGDGEVGPNEGLSELISVHVEDVRGGLNESRERNDVGKLR